jgi:small subunit ribosomal protein S9
MTTTKDTVADTTSTRRAERALRIHLRVRGPPGRRPPQADGLRPGAATGRRKQAIARVRIVPGTGEWTINGRTLENYFPNKVHQQLVNEP